MSSSPADYVNVLCTHRPSFLPIGYSVELFGGDVGVYSTLLKFREA